MQSPGNPRSSSRVARFALVATTAFASTIFGTAHAARPLITDDARVVDPNACQVESWIRKNRDSVEYWALPACNFTGNLELTFGGARTHDNDTGGAYASDIQMQGKLLVKPLATNGWGLAIVAGTVRHPQLPARDWFAYVPTSFSSRDDTVVVHTNFGWLRDGDIHRVRGTWGVGTETRLSERTYLIAEIFGQNRGKASHQIGVRQWIIPDRVQIDATYGNKAGDASEGRWWSIGLRLLSPPFLGDVLRSTP